MRRLIVILIVVAAGVTVLHAYERVGIATVNKEVAAAGVVGRELTVPVTPAFASPDSAATYLPVMEQAAERSRVDVLRTVIGYRAQHGKPFIEELVFLTGPTGLRNVFPLRHGTWLTPRQSRGGADFLSSAATGSREQLGRLRGLRGLPPFSIRPLSAEARDQFFAGDYFVEAQNAARDASFLSTLDSLLAAREQAVGGGTAPARLAYGSPPPLFGEFAVPLVGIASLLGPLEVALAVLLAVVVLYDSLARSKRIGVMRLGGLAPGRIWWQLDGRLVVAGLAAAAVAVWAATWLLEVGPAGLVGSALRAWAATSLLLMVSSGAAWVLARRIRVPEAVKGAKSVGLPLTLDVLVKTGVLAAGVLLSLSSWNDASHDAAVIRRLRAQSVAAPAFARYGLLDQTVGPRLLDYIEEGFSSEQYVQGRWLYPYLVRRGALLIDATDYEPGPRSGTPVLTVSSNFLRAFPLHSTFAPVWR